MLDLKKHSVRIVLGLVITLVFLGHVAKIHEFTFLQQLDSIIYDARLRLAMPRTVDNRIVIVDIDEKSLAEEGRWPWHRDLLALMVDKLFDRYGAEVAGFDMVFAEKDESSGLRVLEDLSRKQFKDDPQYQAALTQARPQLEYDRIFAASLKKHRVLLSYYFSNEEVAGKYVAVNALPPPVLPAGTFPGKGIQFVTWDSYGANLAELQHAAAGAGHINPIYDKADGVNRRVPMLAKYKDAYYEPLSLAIVRALMGFPNVEPDYASDQLLHMGVGAKDFSRLEFLKVGPLKIPVDENVAALVPYRGEQGSFRYISASDVLHDRLNPGELKNKIVLIGTTAPGLKDLRATPVGKAYPGVEIHANLIAGMLDGNIKENPPYVRGAELVLLFLAGVGLTLLMPFLNPIKWGIFTLSVLAFVLSTNFIAWYYGNLLLPTASVLLLVLALFALNMSYGYFAESRIKRQFTDLFGQYVPPELVDKMSQDPKRYSMEGKSQELSVLFSDVRDFTSISEGLEPKELTAFVNAYLTAMTRIIRAHHGTLDKYIGDAIMAFWGAPVNDPDHPRNAVVSALEMQTTARQLREQFKARGWPEIRIGVGINTGIMVVGDMGSAVRKAYTVMGDSVNLASRLEGLCKEYGADIILSEMTKNLVSGIVYRELDQVKVKGKDEPVLIYEPLGIEGQVAPDALDELRLFQRVLRLYRARDWDLAELQLINLAKMAPATRLYKLFLERIKNFRVNPPHAGWDGVWVYETK
ncbi:MAG TPA: adenylate/guanylate cyclase domain-containing protein [Burkholderiales bacterium]|nr:adenylate/guanylate cyclase domain-containing protein [Burkholderiales bacterium]